MEDEKPTYMLSFSVEKQFSYESVLGWMEEWWLAIVTGATLTYLTFIFSVQSYLKDRWNSDQINQNQPFRY